MTLQRMSRGDRAWTQASNTLTQEQCVPVVGCESFPRSVVSILLRLRTQAWAKQHTTYMEVTVGIYTTKPSRARDGLVVYIPTVTYFCDAPIG